MTWKDIVSTLGFLLVVATWNGCETNAAKPPPINCSADDIRTGDTLTISLLDIPEPIVEKQFQVRGDGNVNLPYNLTIRARGKTFGDFEQEVRKSYVTNNIFRSVTVVVKPGDRFYTVDGEVKSPSRQIYSGETTVLRAIATCGGFTEFASRTKVKITRHNGDDEIVDCKKAVRDPKKYDRPICPGDYISVPRSL